MLKRGDPMVSEAGNNKHAFVRIIIFAMIMLTVAAMPCFAAENAISFTEDELAFLD